MIGAPSSSSSISLPMKRLAQSMPAMAVMKATTRPTSMTRPRLDSSPRLPAAAMGPGVGGTKVWVAYSPVARATLMATTETSMRAARAVFDALGMTEAETQDTGMEHSQALREMVRGGSGP